MKTAIGIFAIVTLAFVDMVSANDCQMLDTSIGDHDMLVVGGFTFSRPFEFDLAPTNAPLAKADYSAEFRLVYVNEELPQVTDESLEDVLNMSVLLNGWLREFLEEQYAGMDYDELITGYFDKSFVADVNARFPKFLEPKLREWDETAADSVHPVAVNVKAKGALKSALLEKLSSSQSVSSRAE